ncbi:MAG TPA: sensor histidine kinase [Chitinophagaceae bacterium]|jgi:two-component system, LytTR family, sensor kinase|nr:sensor histidine kinase [Chitinophagaceae bacterium]
MAPGKKSLQIIIHAAVWTGFLLLPFVTFSGPKEMPFNPEKKLQLLFFTTNLFLIGFYYLHSVVLIPKLLAQRKIALYLLNIACILGLFIFIPFIYFQFVELPRPAFVQHMPPPNNMRPNHFGMRRIMPFTFPGTILMFLLILIISGGIKIINQWFKSEQRTEEIEKEKVVTELALLKSQVNPHFLFNTLNNIYSLAVINSPDTATSVLKLSAIMRYVLDDANSNFVELAKEIQFLENYISLQRVRLTEKSIINFLTIGNTADKQIAPLLLIAFVENAFKYGISTHRNSEIDISLKVTENHLSFIVGNQKFQNNNSELTNTGIGITNTKRRLELMYHNKHSLLIENNENSFLVTLTLDLI